MGSHLNHSNFCLVGCNKDAWKPHTSCHPLLIPISLLVRKHLTGPADLTDDQTNSWCSEPPLLPVPPPDHCHFVIVTRFNPQHPDNKKDPMIFNQDNDHSHWTAWMEHQRVENCRGTYPWGTPPYNFREGYLMGMYPCSSLPEIKSSLCSWHHWHGGPVQQSKCHLITFPPAKRIPKKLARHYENGVRPSGNSFIRIPTGILRKWDNM